MSQAGGRPIRINVNGQNLERSENFCYLGSLVTEGHEVKKRIALGKQAFSKKSDLMRRSLSLNMRKR